MYGNVATWKMSAMQQRVHITVLGCMGSMHCIAFGTNFVLAALDLSMKHVVS